jgi:tetratricopeptide (TPR) repeat protein
VAALAERWVTGREVGVTDQLVVLAVGFLLTGVLGGALGYLFQRRAWSHQHEVERRDEQRRQALKTFEEMSALLDRRLYRMRRVYWLAKRRAEGEPADQLAAALDDYREVLLAWNDNLNRMLALVDTYFGGAMRRQLETDVYERYAAVGRALDRFVRQVSAGTATAVPPIGRRLDALSHHVYQLNSRILALIIQERIGRQAPSVTASAGPRTLVVQFGDTGPAVRRLQRALRRAGHSPGAVDGQFGPDTERAVRDFQAARDLDADGVAGPRSWAALPAGTPMPVLQRGASGTVVAGLQAALIEYAAQRWEITPRQADGIFAVDTEAAVQAFQRWHGLDADGVVGDRTWASGLDSPDNTLEGRVGLHHAHPP